LKPSIAIAGAPADAVVELRVLSTGGVATSFTFERESSTAGGADCQPTFRQSGDQPILHLNADLPGRPPYAVSLLIESPHGNFEAMWHWPDDLTAEDTLVGSMQSTSG
jgi:hypothetical protein